jgi:hypothetical protein
MSSHVDPPSFAWGLAIGVTFGAWLRETLDPLLSNVKRLSAKRCKNRFHALQFHCQPQKGHALRR